MDRGFMPTIIEEKRQLPALIQLLGDDDPKISTVAFRKLQELEADHRAMLETAAYGDDDPNVRIRLRRLLDETRFTRLEQELKRLLYEEGDYFDLEQGVFLLSKIESPTVNVNGLTHQLDELALQVKRHAAEETSLTRVLEALNTVLFQQEHFRGNTGDYYDPQNSFIHTLLERRVGIPISLSVLYMLIAKRLSLPVYGISLPTHFLCKYKKLSGQEVFIDVFNKGRILTKKECITYLLRNGFTYRPEYFRIASPRGIIVRMMNNLIHIYQHHQHYRKLNILHRFYQIAVPTDKWMDNDDFFAEDDGIEF